MKPSKALGPFGCVPRKPDPAWDHVSWAARAIGMQIFALVDDFDTMEVATHGDPLSSICKTLSIDGHERRYVKPAIRQLLEMGLLTLGKGCVVVHVKPVKVTTSEREMVDFHTRSEREVSAIPTSKVNQVLGITRVTINRSDQNKEENREEILTPLKSPALLSVPAERQTEMGVVVSPSDSTFVGFRWLNETLGGSAPDLASWREAYGQIGRKSEAERLLVARHMLETPYIAKRRSKATPGHLVKFWTQFVEGPRGGELEWAGATSKTKGPSKVADADAYERQAAAVGEPVW